MDTEVIKLSMGDWSFNAALTGFINIVDEKKVGLDGNMVEIPVNCFENFEEKYFAYFIKAYEKVLPWYKIVSFKEIIEDYRESGLESLSLKKLKLVNEYIKDIVKKYLTSNSFKAAFELIGNEKHIVELEKKLQKIKEPKDEGAFLKEKEQIVAELEQTFAILDKIIEYCESENGKRFIGAMNVIYSIIKKGWDNVCFLFPQTKEKDVYKDYKTYFVDPAIEYLKAEKSKYKYQCFTCGEPMGDFGNDMRFINQSGFDVARKLSHVWNFTNDIALCPVCKLVYSCLPAGFTYVNNTGLYINANANTKYNIKINRNTRDTVNREAANADSRSIYWVLIEAMKKQNLTKIKYELADVQVIRYEDEKYKFNLFPESMIKLISNFESEIGGLIRAGYREGKKNISIYEQVLEHIFNNQNLFLIIHKLLYSKISTPENCFFSIGQVIDLLGINIKLIQNLGGMASMDKERDYLKEARSAGYYLKGAYSNKDKIPGISYRLLNALKTGNRDMFMDVILNCYLYVGKEVPNVITEILRDEDEIFSTIGYAFISGFIDTDREKKSI